MSEKKRFPANRSPEPMRICADRSPPHYWDNERITLCDSLRGLFTDYSAQTTPTLSHDRERGLLSAQAAHLQDLVGGSAVVCSSGSMPTRSRLRRVSHSSCPRVCPTTSKKGLRRAGFRQQCWRRGGPGACPAAILVGRSRDRHRSTGTSSIRASSRRVAARAAALRFWRCCYGTRSWMKRLVSSDRTQLRADPRACRLRPVGGSLAEPAAVDSRVASCRCP